MGRIQRILRPGTIEEAVALLREANGRAMVLAGGTSLSIRTPGNVDTLVDIRRLGLEGIEIRERRLCIKAATRLADLAASEHAKTHFGGILAKAALSVASTPLRNLITVGGNAFHVLPWSDLPGVLLALRAEFVVRGDGERIVGADEFYQAVPRSIIKPHEIITEIRIPLPTQTVAAAYHKASRTRFDYAAVDITTVCWMKDNVIEECRFVVGCARTLPVRAIHAEQELRGKAPSRGDIVTAAARAAGGIEPAQDHRYSPDYRRHLMKIWIKRCLTDSLGIA